MKRLDYVEFIGRKGAPLKYAETYAATVEGGQVPLSTYLLFILAARAGPQGESKKEVNTVIWRKLDKALNVLEPAQDAKGEDRPSYVVLDDEWYGILRPIVDRLLLEWKGNSPYIEDALSLAISEYIPPEPVKVGAEKQ